MSLHTRARRALTHMYPPTRPHQPEHTPSPYPHVPRFHARTGPFTQAHALGTLDHTRTHHTRTRHALIRTCDPTRTSLARLHSLNARIRCLYTDTLHAPVRIYAPHARTNPHTRAPSPTRTHHPLPARIIPYPQAPAPARTHQPFAHAIAHTRTHHVS